MSRIIFDNVSKVYPGNDTPSVASLNMEIDDEEFLVMVGPSGCGKSTAMRMVAGLEEISGGRIIIGDRVVNDLPPKDRNVAMVFQSYALYPHMSVRDNLAYPLKLRKVPKAEREQRVVEAARILDIEQYLDRKPKALSGGQRQRVALGRAIVRNADVFLMDEPLSNLDAKLRVQTRAELVKLHDRVRTTTIYVTHDQTEAMTMGDRIAVMSLGVLQQLDTPQNLYDTPDNKFVAGFMGSPSMNFVDVSIEEQNGKLYAVNPGFRMLIPDAKAASVANYKGKQAVMGIRPEHIVEQSRVPAGAVPEDAFIPVTVDVVELLGNEIFVYLTTRNSTLTARMDPDLKLERGQEIKIALEPSKLHFFDPQTELSIR
ncbi:MAG: sn-glycerol-3-phosphate ABC transporter ATP-binding protein UgpC [Thermomicrobiales bacterium]|nr:sn-glycerol-3-phosphate ABC transporter ATP-binding protein UgpC [Thermomicrobiales bacterium]MCO5219796.1 sn-glycerol-3-phosphate ABC transporter ATP-binding protein UgpC [Thermomicrobiales bacterium]MCO5224767.1 sn-glycerol-3-phosphate ABC transporter ATP-binding protein UgpC [Thermomicrobiales bacterium]